MRRTSEGKLLVHKTRRTRCLIYKCLQMLFLKTVRLITALCHTGTGRAVPAASLPPRAPASFSSKPCFRTSVFGCTALGGVDLPWAGGCGLPRSDTEPLLVEARSAAILSLTLTRRISLVREDDTAPAPSASR